eukprot:tig00021281_g19917.t1
MEHAPDYAEVGCLAEPWLLDVGNGVFSYVAPSAFFGAMATAAKGSAALSTDVVGFMGRAYGTVIIVVGLVQFTVLQSNEKWIVRRCIVFLAIGDVLHVAGLLYYLRDNYVYSTELVIQLALCAWLFLSRCVYMCIWLHEWVTEQRLRSALETVASSLEGGRK